MVLLSSTQLEFEPRSPEGELWELHALLKRLVEYRHERVSLISSENVTSNLLRASYALGLSDQYCSRLPTQVGNVGNLSFSNLSALDEVNLLTRRLVMQLFDAKECEVRPLSGLSGLNILLFALLENGELLFRIDERDGGHLSTGPIARRLNIRSVDIRFNRRFRFDLDQFRQVLRIEKPKVVFLDSSYVLFPYPVAAIRDMIGADTTLVYDASHLIALIPHGLFQSPFEEGADIIHATTHKTLWGPQKSMILFRSNDRLVHTVQDVAKDLVSNTHLHHMLALYVALLEFKHFGSQYAHKLKRNTKVFAEALDRDGLAVVARDQGYTESNQVWVDLGTKEEAIAHFRRMDRTNISVNVILLPSGNWGFRLAVNELTRLGAGATELEALARLIADLVKERRSSEEVARAAIELKEGLGPVQFSLDRFALARECIGFIARQTASREP